MGLILDSSVLIAAERKGRNARQALAEVRERFPNEELALSVVTVLELNHGTYRANSSLRKASRWEFLSEVIATLTIYPVTTEIALQAGQIDGENTANGITIALADLLIGVTALELSYSLATGNVMHFTKIPGLSVISF